MGSARKTKEASEPRKCAGRLCMRTNGKESVVFGCRSITAHEESRTTNRRLLSTKTSGLCCAGSRGPSGCWSQTVSRTAIVRKGKNQRRSEQAVKSRRLQKKYKRTRDSIFFESYLIQHATWRSFGNVPFKDVRASLATTHEASRFGTARVRSPREYRTQR